MQLLQLSPLPISLVLHWKKILGISSAHRCTSRHIQDEQRQNSINDIQKEG
jgi:hypothetical protein